MKVAVGFKDFDLPGIEEYRVWKAVMRTFKNRRCGYGKFANLRCVKSDSPRIVLTTGENVVGGPLKVCIYGWARGKLVFSTRPTARDYWEQATDDDLFRLCYAGIGSILANTEYLNMDRKPTPWMIERMQARYGMPANERALKVVAAEVVIPFEEKAQ